MQYRVKSNLKHNGERFQAGDLVEMSDAEAKQALEAGALEPAYLPFAAQLKPVGEHRG